MKFHPFLSFATSVACLLLAIPSLGLFAAEVEINPGEAFPPAYMAKLPADYLERIRATRLADFSGGEKSSLARALQAPGSGLLSVLWIRWAQAGLMLGLRTKEINQFIASPAFVWGEEDEFAFGFFGTEMFRFYALYRAGSACMPGRLTPAAQAHMEAGFWAVARKHGKLEDARRSVWMQHGSENHNLMEMIGEMLAAQFLRHNPAYALQRYNDGTDLETMYQAWNRRVHAWLDARVRTGLLAEWGSPSYEEHTVNAIFNLRDFAEDPVLRRKAEMFIDLYYAASAEENISSARGGAKMRVKGEHLFEPFSFRGYDLLFNAPGRTFAAIQENVRSSSNYYPPPIIVKLAQDVTRRGSYVILKRQPGVGDDSLGESEKETDFRRLSADRSLLCYDYITPHYAIGSHFYNTRWSYTSDPSPWQGIVFDGSDTARIAFYIKPASKVKWHLYDGYVSAQDRNVLIVQKWHPSPPNHPEHQPSFLQVYFPLTLDTLVEDASGWIFVQSGSSYGAVKVVEGGYSWNEKWQHAAVPGKDRCTITLDQDSPVIVVVNQASDYGNNFAAFQKAVQSQPIVHGGSTLQFSTLTFSGTSELPMINGRIVDLNPARLFDSPFIRSAWNTGLIQLRKGSDSMIFDFTDTNNPVERVQVESRLANFPDGTGSTPPIVFTPGGLKNPAVTW